MDNKTRNVIARLQRVVDAERPSDEAREQVADRLITQDQLRRIDPRLDKPAEQSPRRARRRPPTASQARQLAKPMARD
jgi:hypothetical protein